MKGLGRGKGVGTNSRPAFNADRSWAGHGPEASTLPRRLVRPLTGRDREALGTDLVLPSPLLGRRC